jgi:hypothetical protein
MTGRLWYPQLDVYDSIRRIGGLLSEWMKEPPSPERLFVADFYLANPPLLHKTHMAREVRSLFGLLGVERPEKAFISYPSAPLLFQKMEEVQRLALRTLTGKGLVDLEQLQRGVVRPSRSGVQLFEKDLASLLGESERVLARFIVKHFIPSYADVSDLRRSTGLRRAI